MSKGALPAVIPLENSVSAPLVVTRPIWSFPASANHNAPSGPVVMRCEAALAAIGNWLVIVPSVVMRPILSLTIPVNQRAPSGPAIIPPGLPGPENSVMVPPGVMRPMPLPFIPTSVNQTFPSGPTAGASVARGWQDVDYAERKCVVLQLRQLRGRS